MLVPVFEFGMLLLFVICIADAMLKGRKRLFELAGASLAGLLLEVLAVLYLGIYQYGDGFLVMVMGVPICIGLGWGIVVYVSMGVSDNLGLGNRLRPVFDGLIALNIDLAMDVVAIRIGLWSWDFGGFFGVPYINYLVWFLFVFVCSLTIRWVRSGGPRGFSEARLMHRLLLVFPAALENLVTGTWTVLSAAWGVWKGNLKGEFKFRPGVFEPASFLVVTSIHVFFLCVLVYFRWFGIVWLLVLSGSMLIMGLLLHLAPLAGVFSRRWAPTLALLTRFYRL